MAKPKQKQPEKTSTPNNAPEDDEKTGLAKAWNSWLQPALLLLLFAGIMLGAYYTVRQEWIEKRLIGSIVAAALLIVPVLSIIQNLIEDKKVGTKKRVIIIGLTVISLGAAVWPIVSLVLPGQVVFAQTFTKVDQELPLSTEGASGNDWLIETQGKLPQTDSQFTALYGIRLEGADRQHDLIKGRFERKLGIKRDTGDKEFYNEDWQLHRSQVALGEGAQVKLYSADSETGPITVIIRKQVASWFYFGVLLVPLFLLAALVDALENADRKIPFYSARLAFMLWFGFLFANTTQADDFSGALFVSAAVGLVGALAIAWALPRVLKPLARRIR